MAKNNSSKKKKMSDQQLLRIVFIAASVCFLAFIAIALSSLFGSAFKKKTPDVNWGSVDVDGSVEVDPDVEEKVLDTYVDSDGLPYTRKEIYSLGISLYIPDNWKVNESTETLYLTTDNKNYKGVEISIYAKKVDQTLIETIPGNMTGYIQRCFRYHIQGMSFTAPYYVPPIDTVFVYTDPDVLVWVPASGYSYQEFDEIPRDPEYAGMKWTQKNKYLYTIQSGGMDMTDEEHTGTKASPYYAFGYTLIDGTQYLISVVAPKNYAARCDVIAEAMIKSVQQCKLENLRLPNFSQKQELDKMTYNVPASFEKKGASASYATYISKDFRSDDYGFGITVGKISFYDDVLKSLDLFNEPAYKKLLYNAYTNNDVFNLVEQNTHEIILGFDKAEETVLGGKKAYKYHTSLSLYTDGTELQVKTKEPLPVNGITYLVEDGLDVYVINVTYTGNASEAAEKYARALTKTVRFGD